MQPAASLRLYLSAASLLAARSPVSGLDQNITATVGESALFPKRPYTESSEWVFLGKQRINLNGKDLVYYHRNPQPLVFKAYEGRIQPWNGTFLLMNVTHEDEGWYGQTRDLEHRSYHYIHVLDPVCNVSVVATQSENGVLLRCNFTGKAVSVVWTQNEDSVPASQLLPGNLSLLIPRGEAVGHVQCSVMCGERGWQRAGIDLPSHDGMSRFYRISTIGLAVGITCLVLLLSVLHKVPCPKSKPDNPWSSDEELGTNNAAMLDPMQRMIDEHSAEVD